MTIGSFAGKSESHLGFYGNSTGVALEPILIDPQSDLYTATLNRYIAECETANLPKELTGDNPQLNYSMKNFFAQEAIGQCQR